jgi:hypothetical protein
MHWSGPYKTLAFFALIASCNSGAQASSYPFIPPTFVPMANDPSSICRSATKLAERESQTPPHLLSAIARVESGRRDPVSGRITPWPWTVNAEGQGSYFSTKQEAISFVRQLQTRGVRSIDVGCMQINLQHHPTAFQNLDAAFNPTENARYAARFLTELKAAGREWIDAAGAYHSQTNSLAAPYKTQVNSAWSDEIRLAASEANLPDHAASRSALPLSRQAFSLPPLPSRFQVGQAGLNGPSEQMRQISNSPGPAAISNGSDRAQVLPSPSQGRGRDLEAYRSTPIALASRGPVLLRSRF